MRKKVSGLLAFSMLFFYLPTLGAAEAVKAVKISHTKISCVPGKAQAKLLCEVQPSTSIASVRVQFSSDAFRDKGDYFVEMRRTPGASDSFFAVLPWADTKVTRRVIYKIVVKDPYDAVSSTEPTDVPVLSNSNCPVSLSDAEKAYGSNLVVGVTKPEQRLDPPDGFLCKDIVSVITYNGKMESAEGCRKVLLAAGAAGAGAAGATAGVSTGLLIGGAVVVAGAAGLVIANNTGGGGQPVVSSARPPAQPPTHY
jgi:hypothetical protein